jgi:RHS repeat-associated protein
MKGWLYVKCGQVDFHGRVTIGDPVDVVTGALTDIVVDFHLEGPIPLVWRRYFNSLVHHATVPLGRGFSHEYYRQLVADLDGIRYLRPEGTVAEFPAPDADTRETANGGYRLYRASESRYVVIKAGEPDAEFLFDPTKSVARLTRITEREYSIEFGYDAAARLESIATSDGRTIRVETLEDGRVRRLVLSAQGERPHRTLAAYEYDKHGNLLGGSDAYGQGFRLAYDSHNRLVSKSDRRGYTYTYHYDESGRCIRSAGQDGLHAVGLTFDPLTRTTSVTKGNGGAWVYGWDEAGRVIRTTDPYGFSTTYTFDSEGRLSEEIDPNGNVTRTLYDGAGCPIARVLPSGPVVAFEASGETEDPFTHRIGASAAEWEYGVLVDWPAMMPPAQDGPAPADLPDSAGRVVRAAFAEAEDGTSRDLSEVRDELGLLIRETLPDGRTRRHVYDPEGNTRTFTDFDGGQYRYEWVSWSLPGAETDPLGHTVRYEWTSNAELAAIVDGGGTRSEYLYDLKDRLTAIRRHGVIREQYRYDGADNLIEKLDGEGKTLFTIEPGSGNLDAVRRLRSGENHYFGYDDQGRITRAATDDFEVTCAYDSQGNCTEDKRDGRGVEAAFAGTALVECTVLDHFTTEYDYDEDGAVVIRDPGGQRHTLRLLDHGLVVRQLSNGMSEVTQYDRDGLCLSRALTNGRGSAALRTMECRWSAEGDLTEVRDSVAGTSRFQYDADHRLSSVLLPGGTHEEVLYDGADNLLKKPGLREVTLLEGNRLATANGDRFEYNTRNHIARRTGPGGDWSFQYDSWDMLRAIDTPKGAWTASYDPIGRRIHKTFSGRTTEYFWYDDRLEAELFPDGSLRLYVYADSFAIIPLLFLDYDSLDADPASGKRYFVFCNHIGTPTAVRDEAGVVVWSAEYEPYGAATISPATGFHMPLRFPGHYFDEETGLHYNRFRYYSPELGRFLQSDPGGIEGGLNLYAYTDDPLVQVDVRGLCGNNRRRGKGKGNPRTDGKKGGKNKESTGKKGKGKEKKLSRAEEAKWRKKIDNPPEGKTRNDVRFDRHKARSKAAGRKPLSRNKWDKSRRQLNKNRTRGKEKEDKGRNGLAKKEGLKTTNKRNPRPGKIRNNNENKPVQHTKDKGKAAETTTQPDSIGKDKNGKKIIHDHKDKSGKDKVIYDDKQMQSQREMAGKDGRHVVTTSSDDPNLKGKPPEPRPSKNLAEKSEVYYTDDNGDVTHEWNKKNNRWDPV